jgi:hypothetical protein
VHIRLSGDFMIFAFNVNLRMCVFESKLNVQDVAFLRFILKTCYRLHIDKAQSLPHNTFIALPFQA